MSVDSALGYIGCALDRVTAAYPLGHGYRWYLPSLMRFSAADSLSPFGPGGRNGYVYCGTNPINRTDASGHMWSPATLRRVLEADFKNDFDGQIGAAHARRATTPPSGLATPTRIPGTPPEHDPFHRFVEQWRPPIEWNSPERAPSPPPIPNSGAGRATPMEVDPPLRKLPTFDHVYAQALASLPEITVLDTLSYYANEAKNDILLRRRTLLSLVRVLQKLGVPARYLEGHPSMNALSERLGYQRSVISAMKDDYLLAKPASFERNSELLWWLGYVE